MGTGSRTFTLRLQGHEWVSLPGCISVLDDFLLYFEADGLYPNTVLVCFKSLSSLLQVQVYSEVVGVYSKTVLVTVSLYSLTVRFFTRLRGRRVLLQSCVRFTLSCFRLYSTFNLTFGAVGFTLRLF